MLHMLIYTTVSENCMPISNPQLHSQSKKRWKTGKDPDSNVSLYLFACLFSQRVSFIRLFPWQIDVCTAEMAICCRLLYKSDDVGQAF